MRESIPGTGEKQWKAHIRDIECYMPKMSSRPMFVCCRVLGGKYNIIQLKM